ncbi:helix-turn-helix transcriptional regulator [Paenibacillus polymyxa]|uniref:helix-turn-helix transcriptional regulator n=1 Tax=Paenibacillus polymyxa TaxID=1406 RepID=UPI003D26B4CC
MSNNQTILNKYIPLVDFLAHVLGENNEIVLHDVTNPEHSIVAIRNNYISGREIGGPITDFVLQILKNHGESADFVTNYEGISKSKIRYQSSTYFIRNEHADVIGMLSVNTDLQPYQNIMDAAHYIARHLVGIPQKHNALGSFNVEPLNLPIEDLTLNSIARVISTRGIPPERMNQEEKIEIINELNNLGIFLLKGAVSEVAEQLKTSEATIYRYLKIAQK